MVQELDDASLNPFIKRGQPALILFYSEMCRYCQMFMPIFKEAEMENNQLVRFGAYNCTNGSDNVMEEFKVQYFPSVKFFKQGQFIKDYTGKRSVESITSFIARNL
ncbi:hypothetical protein WA026_010102 [Henosepilachna vigintioctopunctata]|uniref:Thioredoxin domain-containing protein n=1 Tax=Henosepilachna vigintioctopunctata TaxID=420089 RepID=A0AAW1UGE4_9CUCU